MYVFFSELYNSTNVDMESTNSSGSREFAGLLIATAVVLSGSICCGWWLYRRCCSKSTRVTPAVNDAPLAQNVDDVAEITNPAGKIVSRHIIYRDGSTRNIPVVAEEDKVVSITL